MAGSSDEQRRSLDSDVHSSPTSPNGVNGHDENDTDPISRLQRELDHTRAEKEKLASQYSTLLTKLTTMRTTLGNKLKEDADELDRREQLITQLQARNDDLEATAESLKDVLLVSNAEADRLTADLDQMRSTALHESNHETLLRERELRETQTELERCRLEKDEWERAALEYKSTQEEQASQMEVAQRNVQLEQEARRKEKADLDAERDRADNLQSVLADFQAAKEHELSQSLKDYKEQLERTTMSLAEYKSRAHNAEALLDENKSSSSKTQALEQEVKEKNLLIKKLRMEAVIINEHLIEALRRLRRSSLSTDTNVDRRLVTNVLLSYITAPRADPKRFEILSLLSTILNWGDSEREKAGLQRSANNMLSPTNSTGGVVPSSGGFWGRPSNAGVPSPGKISPSPSTDLSKTDETESFSRLWVEFLLTEAQGDSPRTSDANNNSAPASPTRNSPPRVGGTRRLPSFTSMSGLVSPPTVPIEPPPPKWKGKEKEVA